MSEMRGYVKVALWTLVIAVALLAAAALLLPADPGPLRIGMP